MEPIISPFFFYFINLVDNVWGVSIAAAIVSGVVVCVLLVCCACESESECDSFNNIYNERYKKVTRRSILICVISIVICLFVPSKETMIEMAIAKNVTSQNIELAKDSIKGVIDYTIESVEKLRSNDSDKK